MRARASGPGAGELAQLALGLAAADREPDRAAQQHDHQDDEQFEPHGSSVGALRSPCVSWVPVREPRVKRIVVAGASGAGKTTAARRISERLGLPYTEIDGLFHGPLWEPRASLRADVEAFTAEPTWVIEWQYSESVRCWPAAPTRWSGCTSAV